MNYFKKFFVLLIIIGFVISSFAFSDSTINKTNNEKDYPKQKVFGNVFTGFYYNAFSTDQKAGFELSSALLGYSNQLSEKVTAKIVFDFSYTTSGISVCDSNNTYLDVSYTEGSKHTAFLKMAEINYSLNKYLDFKVGQLKNTQYLTFIDDFWGYRYIYTTFQEAYRFGNPADFGAQLDIKVDNILNSISVVNGDGPWRNQDEHGLFLFSNNFQIELIEGLTLKLYLDYCKPESDTLKKTKSAISGFVGYENNFFHVGAEYNYINNYSFDEENDFYGTSVYGGIKVHDNTDIIARWDYIDKSAIRERGNYFILGYQWQPIKNYFISVNTRYYTPGDKTQFYANFGIKF